jgi:alcohol-forming fatty acyl-CoA reductase
VKCPNVYSFTKAVTEQLVRDESGDLPIVIVRPSIVTPAWKEPLPGWTDNVNGPSGRFKSRRFSISESSNELRAGGVAGALAGVIRVIKLNPASVADIVPLDYPINMIIAAAWHKAMHK